MLKILKKYNNIKENYKFMNDWIYLMECLGVYNKKFETYTLRNLQREGDDFEGFKCIIQIPFGLLKSKLLDLKPYIEENLDCKFECESNPRNNFVCAEFKFIN